ncbi:MAG: hypothetical protein V3U24_01850 [Candidatus Neomarinimicrobiota bacterium]
MEPAHSEDEGESHLGTVTIHRLAPFVMYGASNRLNLLVGIPFTHWSQTADEPDAHHRTETVAGFSDITVGAHWLTVNQSFGPGHRFFLGTDLTLPTARSYKASPFSEDADSVTHRHFALGDGVVSSSVDFQWWYRSEFPWVVGITGEYLFPWFESDAGFLPGRKLFFNLHAIGQAPLFPRVYPYIKLRMQGEQEDRWKGKDAPNSGGFMVAAMVGLELEITESVAAVVSIELPVWRRFEGSQLDPFTLSLSLRRLWHLHGS